jgi:hypothetical protein
MHFENHRDLSTDYKISGEVAEKPILGHRHGHRAASGRRTQKPSSARPTQLNAKIEQAIATIEAQVAIVFADRTTWPFLG